ncbi:BAG family molecular chaperone regulator 6 isoform X2 [Andrographis paniculata]|uniref:BAG family molecular chaperone regulator 6 isoform X2 n=1 Tax=Andrographis paniculata TaxID=175694 RepID=UPI0021E935F9|nr:BAG family molecular chaperone regulator 6 isoform X2 [Andrographis paniculata]
MESVYKNLHPYPYHKDQTPYGYRPHHYPGYDGIAPQMYMNSSRRPTAHGYIPWGSNYGCASPVPYHGCCNHSHWQQHYPWSSPYPNIPSYPCPGSCHPYPPLQFMPPGYPVEPQYEYEKNIPGIHHCCGCPNHPLHPAEQKNVRIEEAEPDGEKANQGASLWLPPDRGSNKLGPNENRKPVDAELIYPLDLNKLSSSRQPGHEVRTDPKPVDDAERQHFPYPVVWIPYMPDQMENKEHKVDSPVAKSKSPLQLEGKDVDQIASQAKDIPVTDAAKNRDKENHKTDNPQAGCISPRAKDIPVKQIEQQADSRVSKGQETNSCVKISTEAGEKKLDNGEEKSTKDQPKSSKLPPVCLRVEPLRKSKSTNGSSRSPSPPSKKDASNKTSNEETKAPNSSIDKKEDDIIQKQAKADVNITKNVDHKGDVIDQKEANVDAGITKNVEVAQEKIQQGESGNTIDEIPVSALQEVSKGNSDDNSKESQEVAKSKLENNPNVEIQTSCEPVDELVNDQSGNAKFAEEQPDLSSKRKLSEDEAAVILQAAYRGFEVRRWDPIKKLKQIAEVQNQIPEVEHHIKSMESSSSGTESKSKQRSIIGETIMNLLLKLDTIQGLHPSIRDIRKSVVRELVNLQEQLDMKGADASESAPANDHESLAKPSKTNPPEDVLADEDNNINKYAHNPETSEATLTVSESFDEAQKKNETAHIINDADCQSKIAPTLESENLGSSAAEESALSSNNGTPTSSPAANQIQTNRVSDIDEHGEEVAGEYQEGEGREKENRKLMEENERLREMVAAAMKSGEEQAAAMAALRGRVKELEKRAWKKKKGMKMKMRRQGTMKKKAYELVDDIKQTVCIGQRDRILSGQTRWCAYNTTIYTR